MEKKRKKSKKPTKKARVIALEKGSSVYGKPITENFVGMHGRIRTGDGSFVDATITGVRKGRFVATAGNKLEYSAVTWGFFTPPSVVSSFINAIYSSYSSFLSYQKSPTVNSEKYVINHLKILYESLNNIKKAQKEYIYDYIAEVNPEIAKCLFSDFYLGRNARINEYSGVYPSGQIISKLKAKRNDWFNGIRKTYKHHVGLEYVYDKDFLYAYDVFKNLKRNLSFLADIPEWQMSLLSLTFDEMVALKAKVGVIENESGDIIGYIEPSNEILEALSNGAVIKFGTANRDKVEIKNSYTDDTIGLVSISDSIMNAIEENVPLRFLNAFEILKDFLISMRTTGGREDINKVYSDLVSLLEKYEEILEVGWTDEEAELSE